MRHTEQSKNKILTEALSKPRNIARTAKKYKLSVATLGSWVRKKRGTVKKTKLNNVKKSNVDLQDVDYTRQITLLRAEIEFLRSALMFMTEVNEENHRHEI